MTTYDEYILEVHRVVNPFRHGKYGKPVVLMHDLLSSSATWLIGNAGEALGDGHIGSTCGHNLGFELARRGYDVWLPNMRGNTYSLEHHRVDAKRKQKKILVIVS